MEIVKIEPTPSPNTLKITLNEKKDDMKSRTYTEINAQNPDFINRLLEIDEVKSIFHVLDFISVDKTPRADWENVLPKIKSVFDEAVEETDIEIDSGEKKVEILYFKKIPYQIKLTHHAGEERMQLDVRFIDAMLDAQKDDDNVILLRKWETFGVRYGDSKDIFESVKEEMDALYPDELLQSLVRTGKDSNVQFKEKEMKRVSSDKYEQTTDWQERYRMLDHFPSPDESDIPFLANVLKDEKPQLRRQSVVLLGMIESKSVLPYLYQAMEDNNLTVRRTAGDTLSDLGYKEALPVMHQALNDKHPIVRWRAAMFIYDEGDDTSLPYLEEHLNDEAFDVKLQVQMAYERIKNGEKAVGSVWKQIANRNKGE